TRGFDPMLPATYNTPTHSRDMINVRAERFAGPPTHTASFSRRRPTSQRRRTMTTTVGFIGLGYMGKHMPRNIKKAGYPLVVDNRSQAAVKDLVAEGATAADSPKALAAQVDVVCSCLPGPADVEKVYLGENGVIGGVKPGQILIELSTIDPDTHQ